MRRAFSLIEILVAVTIMSIALVVILSHSLTARRGAHATNEEIRGLGYAEDLIDRIKTMKYEDIVELDNAPDEETFQKLKINSEPPAGSQRAVPGRIGGDSSEEEGQIELPPLPEPFKRFTTIEEVEQQFGNYKTKMKKVRVKVTWTVRTLKESGNIERPVKMELVSLVRKQFN